jgi:predicted metal-dependent enzyme (double-stranded beta helix superfamily)
MTFANISYQKPRILTVKPNTKKINLIINGQGIIIFDATSNCLLKYRDINGSSGLDVHFTDSQVLVHMFPSNEPLIDSENTKGIVKDTGAYYWFSLDSQNQRLYAGIGEARIETVIYKFQFNMGSNREENKLFLESLVSADLINLEPTTLLRDPITRQLPLLIKDTEDLTMDIIASGIHMPRANLSLISQKLYKCIAGKHFVLNTPCFPSFTKAIEYSIATPGKWCYERLKQKATEFNKDKPDEKETYLRITLGENNGESPGIPYVLEIWPVGHYSPIHNHGGSSAIIRVLHGSINVSLFPFLGDSSVQPFDKADFKKNDITWISPTLNQVHQLKNLDGNKDTCITIQCYMYETSDTAHYDYFDYLNSESSKEQYEPDSDMEFIEFKNLMKEEWAERKCSWPLFDCFTQRIGAQ